MSIRPGSELDGEGEIERVPPFDTSACSSHPKEQSGPRVAPVSAFRSISHKFIDRDQTL